MNESRKPIRSNLAQVDAHVIAPQEYDEAPEWTADDFAKAEVRQGERLLRRGRPPLENPKEAVKLRLSPHVLAHFRASGDGWQTRINAILEKAVVQERRKGK